MIGMISSTFEKTFTSSILCFVNYQIIIEWQDSDSEH